MTSEKRAAEILEAVGPELHGLLAEAARLLRRGDMTKAQRSERIVEISEAIGKLITPRTPCANGCSHCCHMATAISGYEARAIGRYVGREPARLGREKKGGDSLRDEFLEKYTGVACPFLDAGRCSVYPVRPIACRLHHSLNDTPDNCKITPGETPAPIVPHLDLRIAVAATAFVFWDDDFGDIREFFP